MFAIVTAGAIWLALRVTPLQTVSTAGQTAQVGATLPSAAPSPVPTATPALG